MASNNAHDEQESWQGIVSQWCAMILDGVPCPTVLLLAKIQLSWKFPVWRELSPHISSVARSTDLSRFLKLTCCYGWITNSTDFLLRHMCIPTDSNGLRLHKCIVSTHVRCTSPYLKRYSTVLEHTVVNSQAYICIWAVLFMDFYCTQPGNTVSLQLLTFHLHFSYACANLFGVQRSWALGSCKDDDAQT